MTTQHQYGHDGPKHDYNHHPKSQTRNSSQYRRIGRSRRRVVIFLGPSKSASSSVESFYETYASNDRIKKKVLPTFENWTYPIFKNGKLSLSDMRYSKNINQRQQIQNHLLKQQPPDINLFLASEYLVSFDTNHMMDYLLNWTTTTTTSSTTSTVTSTTTTNNNITRNERVLVDMIVHYRTPRISQFVSIWKQSTIGNKPTSGYTFTQWLCNNNNDNNGNGNNGNSNGNNDDITRSNNLVLHNKLSKHSNPLGLVLKLLQTYSTSSTSTDHNKKNYDVIINLIDMGGVTKESLDISHVIGCDILHVPCTNNIGWIDGLYNITTNKNQRKKRQPDITLEQLDQLESIFRLRDCSYQYSILSFLQQQQQQNPTTNDDTTAV